MTEIALFLAVFHRLLDSKYLEYVCNALVAFIKGNHLLNILFFSFYNQNWDIDEEKDLNFAIPRHIIQI